MVCCLKLSLYLRVLLLIPSTSALTCQMFYTNQSNHSLKLFTLLKCWTQTEFPLDTSSARKMIKNFWFVDLLHPFRSFYIIFTLFEDIFSEYLLLAISLFSALVKSSVVWSGSNYKWIALVRLHVKRVFTSFFFSFLVVIHDWICKICINNLKRSCSCSFAWWKNAFMLLCTKLFGLEYFASKAFSEYSLVFVVA